MFHWFTGRQVDLVFVVDGSDSLGQTNFDLLRQSILSYVLPQMGDGALHVRIHELTSR